MSRLEIEQTRLIIMADNKGIERVSEINTSWCDNWPKNELQQTEITSILTFLNQYLSLTKWNLFLITAHFVHNVFFILFLVFKSEIHSNLC